MRKNNPPRLQTVLLLLVLLLGGCSTPVAEQIPRLFPAMIEATRTPFQPVPPTPTTTLTPTTTPIPDKELKIWLDPALPDALKAQIKMPTGAVWTTTPQGASLQIGALRGGGSRTAGGGSAAGGEAVKATWVYALVTPFPSLVDDINADEVERAWRGEAGQVFAGPLMLSASTKAAFETRWGPPAGDRLQVVGDEGQILDKAWSERPTGSSAAAAWALIPFEQIQPRWKVLHINGMSLFDKSLKLEDYPLTIWFGISGQPEAISSLQKAAETQQPRAGEDTSVLPASNRDTNQMTVLVMTGVTALARATGYKMDVNGTTYPARDIADWLRNADLTHISNEVSFNEACPKANFADTSTMFCSRPEYIELLDFIGTDIVELSGNHNNDYGRAANAYSLELYKQRGWATFAGGANLEEARKPALIENNGNKLAFIGCNPAGPPGAWATSDDAGAAPCGDYGWMLDNIKQLRGDGYLPIVTFQYFEVYTHGLSSHQEEDFRAAVDAGAVIISGSQAHFPQYMEFYNDAFIHYGLGNLFFDQMDIPVVGTRDEFIDRHVFYAGKYISTELLTAELEDYARPRPMTESERSSFLQEIFSAAGW